MTADIRKPWLNVARRMQQVSCNQGGYAIVTIRLMVGPDGNPVFWYEPDLNKLEPIASTKELFGAALQHSTKT